MMTNIDYPTLMRRIGSAAKSASHRIAAASTESKNLALTTLARLIRENHDAILAANEHDVRKARAFTYPDAFIDRLTLTPAILETMALGCEQIAALEDPIGHVSDPVHQACGIDTAKMRVPLGVVAIIFESRPNVTIDAAALTIKSGNAAILRGGKEAFESNQMLGGLVSSALTFAGLPAESVQIVPTTDHAFVQELITATEYVDVLIPRGGKSLISRLEKESRIPMLKHLDGICHTYVDKAADIAMAIDVTDNAKTQRYAPCNATETLLVHADIASEFLPKIAKRFEDKSVEMRCDSTSKALLSEAGFSVKQATPEDWKTEYNAPTIAIAVVDGLDAAIDFINTNGSQHTDAIITNDVAAAKRFLREVDSGSVMHNCSTRLADGFIYGLGAEIGISTGKLHARGPVGLLGLTSEKFIVYGHGELRH